MSFAIRAYSQMLRVNSCGSRFMNGKNLALFGRCFPTRQGWYLEVKALDQKRFSQTSTKKISGETRSETFRNYATGFGSLAPLVVAIAALYTLVKSNTKEQKLDQTIAENRDSLEAAKKLGLVKVQEYVSIPQQQAECYNKAKQEVYIIGVTGARVFDEKKGSYNPIPETLKELMKNDVKVKLMVYDPDISCLHTDRKDPLTRIEKIKKSILDGKKWEKEFPGQFEIRLMETLPPFHGDLIDHSQADVTPIWRTGLGSTKKASTETYVDSGTKIADIKSDFETVWENSKKPK